MAFEPDFPAVRRGAQRVKAGGEPGTISAIAGEVVHLVIKALRHNGEIALIAS